jgi:hypothetical protein
VFFTERCPLSIVSKSPFASYEAAYRIIPCQKLHTARRNLIFGVGGIIDIITGGRNKCEKAFKYPFV